MQMTGQVECKWVGRSVQLPSSQWFIRLGHRHANSNSLHEAILGNTYSPEDNGIHTKEQNGSTASILLKAVDHIVRRQEAAKPIDIKCCSKAVHPPLEVLPKERNNRTSKPKRIMNFKLLIRLAMGWLVNSNAMLPHQYAPRRYER